MSIQSDNAREQLDDLLERGEISRESFAEYGATEATALWSAPHAGGQTPPTGPTQFVEADGIRFAYRRFGNPAGTPTVLLQHFMGNLDNYDPAITDAVAIGREVILTDNAGVGLSTGSAPDTVNGMTRHVAAMIGALGLDRVDVFRF